MNHKKVDEIFGGSVLPCGTFVPDAIDVSYFIKCMNDNKYVQTCFNNQEDMFSLDCFGDLWYFPKRNGYFSDEFEDTCDLLLQAENLIKYYKIKINPNICNINFFSCGSHHFSAIDSNGKLWYYEKLMEDSTFEQCSINKYFKFVNCGTHSTYAIDTNGSIWYYHNQNFEYPNYNNDIEWTAGEQIVPFTLEKMYYPVSFINLDSPRKYIQVYTDGYSTLFLDDDGIVWCMGINNNQFGIKNVDKVENLTQIHLDTKISFVTTNFGSSFLIDETQQLWVSGKNEYGKLGFGDVEDKTIFTKCLIKERIKLASIFSTFTCLIDEDYNIWMCGTTNAISTRYHLDVFLNNPQVPNILEYDVLLEHCKINSCKPLSIYNNQLPPRSKIKQSC